MSEKRERNYYYVRYIPSNLAVGDILVWNGTEWINNPSPVGGGGGTGDVTGAANVGGGAGQVFRDEVGGVLNMKSLLAGANVTITDNANDITVASTAGGASIEALVHDYILYKVGSTYKIFKVATSSVLTTTTTDCSTLINAAIADMDVYGGTIYVKPNKYPCLTTINVHTDIVGALPSPPSGAGSGGVNIVGNGYGSWLDWSPASALTDAISWIINGSKMESLRLVCNSNVTNYVHVKGHASTVSHAGRNAFEHMFFEGPNTDTPIAGQRGIFMDVDTLQGAYYFKYIDCHFFWLGHGYYAPTTGGDATTAFFESCDWDRCNTGIYIAGSGQNFGNNLYFQGATDYGTTGLHLGGSALMNYFNNLTGEFLLSSGQCQTVLLDAGADWNVVRNIINATAGAGGAADAEHVRDNSGNTHNILDWYSPAATKTIGYKHGRAFQIGGTSDTPTLAFNNLTQTTLDYLATNLPINNQTRTRFGHNSGAAGAGYGLFDDNLSTTGTFSLVSLGGGVNPSWITPGSSQAQAGFRSNTIVAERAHNFVVRFRITVTNITGTRGFIGFVDDAAAFRAHPDPLNAKSGIGLWWDTSTTANWRIANNDGTGSTIHNDLSTPTAVDTTYHEVQIKANDASSRFEISFDNLAVSNVTADIPAANTELAFQAFVQTNSAATKTMRLSYCDGETNSGND